MLMRLSALAAAASLAALLSVGCGSEEPLAPGGAAGDSAALGDPVDVPQADPSADLPENNLSFPAIWGDGWALPLRGTQNQAQLGGACEERDGELWYLQQDSLNVWQAGTAGPGSAPVALDWVNWGDNLEARSWTVSSKVRAEVVLLCDLPASLTGYEMLHLSGRGPDEVWGCNGLAYDSPQATVYSHCARFTIQKLTADPATATLAWDPQGGRWTGDVLDPVFNHTVWEGDKGHKGGYAAEINIQGKLIYGTLWDVAAAGQGAGVYRLTFSLSTGNPGCALNTRFTADTRVVPSSEEEETVDGDGGGGRGGGGGVAAVDAANNLSYIDVLIVESTVGGGN